MRRSLIIFYTLSLLLLILNSCRKEHSYEGGPPAEDTDTDNGNNQPVKCEWEFKENQVQYAGPVDTAYLQTTNDLETLQVIGHTSDGKEKILIIINDNDDKIKVGKVYKTSGFESKFIYRNQTDTLLSAIPYYGGDLNVTITSIDSTKVTGTFKGLVKTLNRGPQDLTEGKFSSPLKTLSTAQTNGGIIFYSEGETHKPVNVQIGQQLETITTYSLVPPDCGEEGRANFLLPPGTYEYLAWSGLDTINGQVEAVGGACKKIKLYFEFVTSDSPPTDEINCLLSAVDYGPTPNLFRLTNDVDTEWEGSDISNLLFYVSPAPVRVPHPITRIGDTIFIDKGSQYEIYFVTDANGKVRYYSGVVKPDVFYPRTPLFIEYQYDIQGNLVRRIAKNSYNYVITDIRFVWQNGNITRIREDYPLSGDSKECNIEYFEDHQVSHFPFTFDQAPELILFQPLLNLGNHLKNAPKHYYFTALSGNTVHHYFTDYRIDGHDYVYGFSRNNGGDDRIDFNFEYKCD